MDSTTATTLPVRPPMRFKASVAPLATRVRTGPAEDDTRDKPSDAFDAAVEAVADAVEAASDAACAACDVAELCRVDNRPTRTWERRNTARDAGYSIDLNKGLKTPAQQRQAICA